MDTSKIPQVKKIKNFQTETDLPPKESSTKRLMKEELKVVREFLNKRNKELNEANSLIYQKDCLIKQL